MRAVWSSTPVSDPTADAEGNRQLRRGKPKRKPPCEVATNGDDLVRATRRSGQEGMDVCGKFVVMLK